MGDKRYYLVLGEREKGPYTLAQLREAVQEKVTASSSLVRAEDETQKRPLSELIAASPDPPADPPAGPLASMRRDTQARELAASMLKDGKSALNVLEALVATGMRPEDANALVHELQDVLPTNIKIGLYVATFAPGCGFWGVVVATLAMYYGWRHTYPNRASEIKKHGGTALLIGLFVNLVLFAIFGRRH